MFEKFLSENIENFRQRYEGTFGFYRDEEKKRLLVKLSSISAERVDFIDGRGVTWHMEPNSPRDIGFEFLPPKSAWYNTQQWGAVYLQRIAQRQFLRGVTSKNLEVLQAIKGELYPRRVDFALLSAVYEEALTPQQAFKRLTKSKAEVPLSMAISSQFALDPSTNSVRVLKEVIGDYSLEGNAFRFRLSEPQLWRTEINDAITALGATADIS